ncbi:MAG TPA: Hsp20/alpha crystallin family protein [Acidobacteriota bacterium]|nr:Hsp20/alpha crystallin family protein [Acidobacteriota bacterium]
MAKKIKTVSKIISIERGERKKLDQIHANKNNLLSLEETWIPAVDIAVKENKLIIEVELPGVKREDITVRLTSSSIEIKGVKKDKVPKTGINYFRLEREYGQFSRFIFLPYSVDPEKAEASIENGILTIEMIRKK